MLKKTKKITRRCKLDGCDQYINVGRRGKHFCCDNHAEIGRKISKEKSLSKNGYSYRGKYKFEVYDESETKGTIAALLKRSLDAKPEYRHRCRTCGCRITDERPMIRDVTENGDMVYYCASGCESIKLTDEMMTTRKSGFSQGQTGTPFKMERCDKEVVYDVVHKEPKFGNR